MLFYIFQLNENSHFCISEHYSFRYTDVKVTRQKSKSEHDLYENTDVDVVVAYVSFHVINVGKRTGADVPQLYVAYPASAGAPPRQLRAFQRTQLIAPLKGVLVSLPLTARDLSVFSGGAWQRVHGRFTLFIAASSRDLRKSLFLEI